MKRNLFTWVTSIIFFFFSTAIFAAADTYTIDPNHSFVLWHISHFGFSHPSGKWAAHGDVVLDEAKPQNSKVNATIQVGEFITGIPELDKHLKAPVFFDVKQFPIATFVSDKVEITGKKTAKVHGILTVRGVSKPVTLNVKLNQLAMSPVNDKQTAGFTASTTLKRSDFGITTALPGLGDEVKIDIEVEANKNK